MTTITLEPAAKQPRLEHSHWADTGCAVSSSCLICPLPQCKYDDPYWYARYRRGLREQHRMEVMEKEGLTNQEAADRFGISLRSIFRMKRRVKRNGATPPQVESVYE